MITYTKDFADILAILTNNDFHVLKDGDELYESFLLDDYHWEEGASKVVVCLDNCVLKRSYSGSYTYEDDEETGEEIVYDEEEFPDYAKTEWLVYQAAAQYGIQHLFAHTIQINDKVYAQERVDFTADQYENSSCIEHEDYLDGVYFDGDSYPPYIPGGYRRLEELCKANKLGDFNARIRPSALNYILAAWSPEDLRQLSKFLKEYDINDIHTANIGWINGELKIFDFCGFKTNTSKLVEIES